MLSDFLPAEVDGSLDTSSTSSDGKSVPTDLLTDGGGKGPPYPFVLCHGFFGFDKVGPLDYFYKVKPALLADGYQVEITTVDPFNTTYKRGEQLLAQVQAILKTTGAAKVNLVGHSQGGIDARYVAAKLPGRVASVTTIASPHLGASIADVLLDKTGSWTQSLADAFLKAVAPKVWGDPASDADLKAALQFMKPSSMTAFNAQFPDVDTVKYYSIGGRSDGADGTDVCYSPVTPAFLSKYAKVTDPIDPLLWAVAKVIQESVHKPKVNDGMVVTQDSKWGTWLGCIPADHMDEVGQLLGDSPGSGNSFNYINFYRDLLAWLQTQGF